MENKIIICITPDITLLGTLVRAGYDVKYFANISLLPSNPSFVPQMILIDGMRVLPEEIRLFRTIFPRLPHIIVRSDHVGGLDDPIVIELNTLTTGADVLTCVDQCFMTELQNRVQNTKKKVLIIEDNRGINEMYQIAFESGGYEVVSALDGLDGIAKAAEHHPDIILLDLMMPNMDGFEMLQALRSNTTTLQATIIVNTNLEGVDEENRARTLGADFFLRKSTYTPLEVVDMILKGTLK